MNNTKQQQRQRESKINVGEVGFTFYKFFQGHGWFQGRVTQIRPNAAKNKTRRILYSDGDVEDVSVKEIYSCMHSYAKYLESRERVVVGVVDTQQPVQGKEQQDKATAKEGKDDKNIHDKEDNDKEEDDDDQRKVGLVDATRSSLQCNNYNNNNNNRHSNVMTNSLLHVSNNKRKAPSSPELKKKVSKNKRVKECSKLRMVPRNHVDVNVNVNANVDIDEDIDESPHPSIATDSTQGKKVTSLLPLPPSSSSTTLDTSSPRRRSSRRTCDGQDTFGQVGFIFTKDFIGSSSYGNSSSRSRMRGMVVEVLPGFLRRCVYSDGFQEDITVNELLRLVRLENNRRDSGRSSNKTEEEIHGDEIVVKHDDDDDDATHTKQHNDKTDTCDSNEIDFEMADDIIPMDDTVKSVLQFDKQVNKDEEKKLVNEQQDCKDEESLWLTKVATLVNSKVAKSKQQGKSVLCSSSNATATTTTTTTTTTAKDAIIATRSVESECLCRIEIDAPVLLNRIPKKKRLGCKVVCIMDENKIVGKVLDENNFGWVEVDVGGGVIKKDRTGKFVAVSSKYTVGECMKDDLEASEEGGTKVKRSQQGQRDGIRYKETCSIGSVFYWYCRSCKVTNQFVEEMCKNCKQRRVPGTQQMGIPSCLLEIVENACLVSIGDDGRRENKTIVQPFIPQSVKRSVEHILQDDYVTAKKIVKMSPPLPMDSVFYWKCSHCTVDNSFKRWSCNVCKRKKTDDAILSPLLQIAAEAAKEQLHLQDAVERIPDLHSCAIPDIVMRYLVTCIAIASSSKRRCLLPKLENSDYCTLHQDVISLNNDKVSDEIENQSDDVAKEYLKEKEAPNPFVSVDCLMNDIRSRLRNALNTQENARNWEIKCIEDAFLCERNEPYPLGLMVRRYFPGHGFHDGYIFSVAQKQVMGDGELRPVLVYRIKYNDGDEEDLLHHEVNSLRQIYNVRSVKPSSSSNEQIKARATFKTLNGNVQVLRTEADENNPKDNGKVFAKLSKPNQAEIKMDIDLMKFQKFVVNGISHKRNTQCIITEKSSIPFLEWPPHEHIACNEAVDASQYLSLTERNLKMHMKPVPQDNESDDESKSIEDEHILTHVHRIVDDETRHCRIGVSHLSCHDPAGVRNFISYKPFESMTCAICQTGEDDHYLLICDDCDKGYHTYCLRPVVVNIPRGDWSCNKCGARDCTLVTFEDILAEVKANPTEKAFSFLKLPFMNTIEFCKEHKNALILLQSRAMWRKQFPKARISEKVDGIHISRNKDRHLFVLPEPPEDPQLMFRSITSIAAAVQYCGMEYYSEELIYNDDVPTSMNNAELDLELVSGLSKRNLQLFEEYKHNLKLGVYPPVEIVYDSSIGFMVRALAKMKRHTIITEYVGQVTTVDKIGSTSSDSLMNLLQTGDDETSLIIDPSSVGNMARFFSGINNRKNMSKKKANIRTRRFALGGRCRVVLFTAKDIQEGEILHYDYNAGIEGKDIESMIRMGFYDTSNFL